MEFQNMRIAQVQTVVRYRATPTSFRKTNRRNHIMGINLTGRSRHDLGYTHLDLEPGVIYFFNQRDDYECITDEAGECYSVHFTTFDPIETDSFSKRIDNVEEIERLVRRVENAWLERERGELRLLLECYALAEQLYRLHTVPYAPRDERVWAARTYLDLHFKEEACLDAAAAVCGISRRRFNDIFRGQFGITPNGYVINKKLSYARELLKLGDLSPADVAAASGFSDVYYFSKVFHRYIGTTPSKYRKQFTFT